MRKVVAVELVSVDGVMEEANAAGMAHSDALLLGRVTYEALAAFWPNQPGGTPMVDYINSVPKHVLSTTLKEPLEWQNSTLIKGNGAEEIVRLKRQPGKDITILGSGALVWLLLRDGPLDELRLMVHPIVVGSGKRLFEDGGIRRRCSSWPRRPSARAFSISATSRCKAEAIIGLGHLILALLLSLFTRVRGGVLRSSDAPFACWNFFTKIVKKG